MIACASTDNTSANGAANGSFADDAASADINNFAFTKKEPILSVVHPDFQLTNGFIEPVQRQSSVPEGYIAISTPAEFCKIELNPAANYILMGDIDLTGMEFSSIKDFTGTLEGNGYTVSYAQTPLFLSVDGGTIENLGVYDRLGLDVYTDEASLTVSYNGATAGYWAYGGIASVLSNGATLFNCWFDGTVETHSVIAGGLVWRAASGSTIRSCRNGASIYIATDWVNDVTCGGIAGEIAKNVTVVNCLNEGALKIDAGTQGAQRLGGIVGQVELDTGKEAYAAGIFHCRNTGKLSGRDYTAGILGWLRVTEACATVNISQCLNEGEADPATSLSGIVNVGYIEEGSIVISNCANVSPSTFTTGIVGGEFLQRRWTRLSEDLMNVRVEYCFNASTAAQGISSVGKNLDYCYYLGEDTPATAVGALFATVKGLTQKQMQSQNSYAGFDFDTVWSMGSGYPEFCQTVY